MVTKGVFFYELVIHCYHLKIAYESQVVNKIVTVQVHSVYPNRDIL